MGDIANGHRLDADGVWRRHWQVGDIANGHRLGPDGVWHRFWQVGEVANGHRLGPDGVWRPVSPAPVPPRPRPVVVAARRTWYRRPAGVVGLVAGSLLLIGAVASAAADRPADDAPPASAPEVSAPSGPDPEPGAETSPPASTAPAPSPSGSTEPADKGVAATSEKQSAPAEPRTYLVVRVIDGDTVQLGNGDDVRLVGIDTPEQGECGSQVATDHLVRLVQGRQVRLTMSDEDTDRYGRLLRYVDVGGVDAGLSQIKHGFAIARYDSRDGYGFHPREPVYVKADRGTRQFHCPKPAPAPQPLAQPANCMAGYSPCLPVVPDLDCGEIGHPVSVTGSDPYRLDADGDGVGCDS